MKINLENLVPISVDEVASSVLSRHLVAFKELAK